MQWLGSACKKFLSHKIRLHNTLSEFVVNGVFRIAQICGSSGIAGPFARLRKTKVFQNLADGSKGRDLLIGVSASALLLNGTGSKIERLGVGLEEGMQLSNPGFGLLCPFSSLPHWPSSTILCKVLAWRLCPSYHKVLVEPFDSTDGIFGKAAFKIEPIKLSTQSNKFFCP